MDYNEGKKEQNDRGKKKKGNQKKVHTEICMVRH